MRKRAAAFILFLALLLPMVSFAAEWKGVDEAVVEKIAGEHGREASPPLINTDKGDLLLFMFTISGAIGGFAAGYFFRMLFAEKKEDGEDR
ncbi:MAG: hypothetical protein M0Z59_07050 [Nitrospiraceae bacterium]|nr:hypothetical protein [Nitrospiraceae bacterium]